MRRDCKIKTNSLTDTMTQGMHHLKLLLARKPDHVILQCVTNNLMNGLYGEDVANKILKLGQNVASPGTRCSISILVSRRDELESMVRNKYF